MDSTRLELKAGDAAMIAPDHGGYVVGHEPFVVIDFAGAKEYAKRVGSQEVPKWLGAG